MGTSCLEENEFDLLSPTWLVTFGPGKPDAARIFISFPGRRSHFLTSEAVGIAHLVAHLCSGGSSTAKGSMVVCLWAKDLEGAASTVPWQYIQIYV